MAAGDRADRRVVSMHFRPSVQPTANGIIEDLVPMIMGLKEPEMNIWLAPLFVVIDGVLGAGIWFLQRWARVIIVIDLSWLFVRAAVGLMALVILHPKGIQFRAPSPYFAVNILVSFMMLSWLWIQTSGTSSSGMHECASRSWGMR